MYSRSLGPVGYGFKLDGHHLEGVYLRISYLRQPDRTLAEPRNPFIKIQITSFWDSTPQSMLKFSKPHMASYLAYEPTQPPKGSLNKAP